MEVEEEDESPHLIRRLLSRGCYHWVIASLCRYFPVTCRTEISSVERWVETILLGRVEFAVTRFYVQLFPDEESMRIPRGQIPDDVDAELQRYVGKPSITISDLDRHSLVIDLLSWIVELMQTLAGVEICRDVIDCALTNLIHVEFPTQCGDLRATLTNDIARILFSATHLCQIPDAPGDSLFYSMGKMKGLTTK